MKLNIGCGKKILDGWTNIDAEGYPGARQPDIICTAGEIPLPDSCASEIMAIHLFEHLYRWECDAVLDEWTRLLKTGGTLVLEMPDLYKYCQNILDGRKGKHPDQLGMWGMFGDPGYKNPAMCHRWGWTFSTIKPLLEAHGFGDIVESATEWHQTGKFVRDFRVTAVKQ